MEERLAILVESFVDLDQKLKEFLRSEDRVGDLYRGQVKRNKESLSIFVEDEEIQEAITKWIQRRKYAKLLKGWVKGLNIDWNQTV